MLCLPIWSRVTFMVSVLILYSYGLLLLYWTSSVQARGNARTCALLKLWFVQAHMRVACCSLSSYPVLCFATSPAVLTFFVENAVDLTLYDRKTGVCPGVLRMSHKPKSPSAKNCWVPVIILTPRQVMSWLCFGCLSRKWMTDGKLFEREMYCDFQLCVTMELRLSTDLPAT